MGGGNDSEPTDTRDRVELGVELLACQEEAIDLSEAVDRLEAVTSNPRVVRQILETAERRGVIERADAVLRSRRGQYVSYESAVVTREGEFECRRCGAGLSTGHFIQLEAGELGPFGSSCVRHITGRD